MANITPEQERSVREFQGRTKNMPRPFYPTREELIQRKEAEVAGLLLAARRIREAFPTQKPKKRKK